MEPHADETGFGLDHATGTIVPPICFYPERRTLPAALLAASVLASGAAVVLLARWLLT